MQEDLKRQVVTGVIWRLAERFGMQAMHFIVGIVLARLLGPEAYGTIALLTIFIAVCQVLVDSGFGSALIQKKEVSECEYSSVFFLSIMFSLSCYVVLYLCAPMIAHFYSRPILVPVLRVTAINLVLFAINGVQNAVLARKMLFNLSFRISLSGVTAGGILGIVLAYLGYGVWALVFSSLLSSSVMTIVRWYLIGWRPRLLFSFKAIRPLFDFSWKLLVSGILESLFSNLYGLVIGRVYSPSDLAFYNKGQAMPRLVMDSVNGTLGTVAFPALSKLQDEPERLKRAMRAMIRISTYFVMPLMALLAAAAEPIILFLYGEDWRTSIVFVQIACISYALFPFHTINLQGIQAMGRSDIFLKLEVLKKLLCIVSLFVVYKFGVITFALVGAVAVAPLSVIINAWPNRKLLAYGVKNQLCDVLPSTLMACVMFLVSFPFVYIGCSSVAKCILIMILQAVVGMGAHILLIRIFRPDVSATIGRQFPLLARVYGMVHE